MKETSNWHFQHIGKTTIMSNGNDIFQLGLEDFVHSTGPRNYSAFCTVVLRWRSIVVVVCFWELFLYLIWSVVCRFPWRCFSWGRQKRLNWLWVLIESNIRTYCKIDLKKIRWKIHKAIQSTVRVPAKPMLEAYMARLERFELFSTNQCYYLVGCKKLNTCNVCSRWIVLHHDWTTCRPTAGSNYCTT